MYNEEKWGNCKTIEAWSLEDGIQIWETSRSEILVVTPDFKSRYKNKEAGKHSISPNDLVGDGCI